MNIERLKTDLNIDNYRGLEQYLTGLGLTFNPYYVLNDQDLSELKSSKESIITLIIPIKNIIKDLINATNLDQYLYEKYIDQILVVKFANIQNPALMSKMIKLLQIKYNLNSFPEYQFMFKDFLIINLDLNKEIKHMICQVMYSDIVCFGFTNSAANQLNNTFYVNSKFDRLKYEYMEDFFTTIKSKGIKKNFAECYYWIKAAEYCKLNDKLACQKNYERKYRMFTS